MTTRKLSAGHCRQLGATPEGHGTNFAISRNHVVKIVHQLGIKGYIETVRGKHGGIRLGRAAVSINLRDVVMDMEHVLCPVDCKRENCRLSGGCRIQGILRRAMHAFLEVLGEYTLADAVRDPTRLCHLLGIEQDNILTMA